MPQAFERLSAQDASFLEFERLGYPMIIGGPAIFENGPLGTPGGGVDIERIRAHFAAQLRVIPRYRQRLAFSPWSQHPYWIDDQRFNLASHVRHVAVPRPGGERELKHLTAWVLSQPLDWDRPLWESWIVEGLAGNRFALITKTHHCMVDGVSGVDLFSQLMRPTADADLEEAADWNPRPAPSPIDLFVAETAHRLGQSMAFLRELGNAVRVPEATIASLREGVGAAWSMLHAGIFNTAETPLNGPIGSERRFDWLTVDLGDVKAVKNRLGGTVNDVLLTAVAGGARRFLERQGVDVDHLDFRALVPVNMRTAAEHGMGNRVSAWFLPMPIRVREPRKRLAAVSAATALLKQRHEAQAAELLNKVTEIADTLLAFSVRLVSRLHPYHLVVTNIRGPSFPLYLLGARLIEGFPLVPLFANQGVAVAMFTNADRVCYGFNADWDLVPNLPFFVAAVRDAFRELHDLATTTSTATSRPAPRQPKASRGAHAGRPGRRRAASAGTHTG